MLADHEWKSTPFTTSSYTLQSQKYIYYQKLLNFKTRIMQGLIAMYALSAYIPQNSSISFLSIAQASLHYNSFSAGMTRT